MNVGPFLSYELDDFLGFPYPPTQEVQKQAQIFLSLSWAEGGAQALIHIPAALVPLSTFYPQWGTGEGCSPFLDYASLLWLSHDFICEIWRDFWPFHAGESVVLSGDFQGIHLQRCYWRQGKWVLPRNINSKFLSPVPKWERADSLPWVIQHELNALKFVKFLHLALGGRDIFGTHVKQHSVHLTLDRTSLVCLPVRSNNTDYTVFK